MTDWSRLVKPSLGGVEPYDPGESLSELKARYGLSEVVKLNWNEGLFGPGPGVLEAAAAELQNAWMYPEQAYADLRDAVAEWRGVRPRQVVPGHGIQALVATVAAAFIGPGTPVVVPTPTYGLYAQVFVAAGAKLERVPVRADLGIDLAALAGTAARMGARLVLVCDPNNPTGAWAAADEWQAFLHSVPDDCVVLVDEAYGDYVDIDLRLRREDDIQAGRPVLTLHTFSKLWGLAGLRLGYAVCSEELAHYLHVVQEPFNVNRAALAAGRASLAVPGLAEERRRQAAEARELLARRLADVGAEPHPSQANFVLAGVGVDDVELTERLRRRGLLIRAGSEFGLDGTVRITVGPTPLMERAAAELGAVREELLRARAPEPESRRAAGLA
jgi:histidinol-phosphate aminotransferase